VTLERVVTTFTPSHRGGSGSPLVLLHGFSDTWRIWELVLPMLERRHDVLALTLPGHAGGPPLQGEVAAELMPDAVQRAMDEAGFETAHFAGNSLGGFVALQLAARDRARSVVAFAPAGGWPKGDAAYQELLASQARMCEQAKATAPHAAAIVSTLDGRRQATRLTTVSYEHIPAELLAHQMLGTAGCAGAPELVEFGMREGFELDAEHIACPVRIVWGTNDVIVPWPQSAVRYRREWLPHADWVELEGVGHCPPLDVPLETAQLILGFTG
jgi:pimeloyl-ACP methyl ester carboxylesterase